MAVVMMIVVFWDVVLYSVVKVCKNFGGTYSSILGYNPADRSSMFFRNVRKFLPTYTTLHSIQDCSISTLRKTNKDVRFYLLKCSDLSSYPVPLLTPKVAVRRSFEEFCALLSVILQWHAKLQNHEGQGFFVEPECKSITS
jgi:hypothetical protein